MWALMGREMCLLEPRVGSCELLCFFHLDFRLALHALPSLVHFAMKKYRRTDGSSFGMARMRDAEFGTPNRNNVVLRRDF